MSIIVVLYSIALFVTGFMSLVELCRVIKHGKEAANRIVSMIYILVFMALLMLGLPEEVPVKWGAPLFIALAFYCSLYFHFSDREPRDKKRK